MHALHTPWGPAQSAKHHEPGIICTTTASHGGIHVTPEGMERMPSALRGFRTFAGYGWYEEDCDVIVVMLAFPNAFPPCQVASALRAIELDPYFQKRMDSDVRAFLASPESLPARRRAEQACTGHGCALDTPETFA